jgi:hypothetical protein
MAADKEHPGGHRSSIVVIGSQGNIYDVIFKVAVEPTSPPLDTTLKKEKTKPAFYTVLTSPPSTFL